MHALLYRFEAECVRQPDQIQQHYEKLAEKLRQEANKLSLSAEEEQEGKTDVGAPGDWQNLLHVR